MLHRDKLFFQLLLRATTKQYFKKKTTIFAKRTSLLYAFDVFIEQILKAWIYMKVYNIYIWSG